MAQFHKSTLAQFSEGGEGGGGDAKRARSLWELSKREKRRSRDGTKIALDLFVGFKVSFFLIFFPLLSFFPHFFRFLPLC